MFFTVLLILWLTFSGLALMESKLFNQNQTSELAAKYVPIRLAIIVLSITLAIVYIWNLSENVNIQNIVMTTLMLVAVFLSVEIVPKRLTNPEAKNLKSWMIFRNVVVILNVITMFVHFIIFVVLA